MYCLALCVSLIYFVILHDSGYMVEIEDCENENISEYSFRFCYGVYMRKNRVFFKIINRFYLITFLFLFSHFALATAIGDSLKSLPVQTRGRVQPFDTFARNSLRFVYGKTRFNTRPAVDVLMSWMLLPEYWNETEFIQVRDSALRKALQLDLNKILFSPKILLKNENFIQEVAELRIRQQNKEPLDDYFKSVQKLENRLLLYQAFQRGDMPGWVPSSVPVSGTVDQVNGENWLPLGRLKEGSEEKKLFQKIVLNYVSAVSLQEQSSSQGKNNKQELQTAVDNFKQQIKLKYPAYENNFSKMSVELHYNNLNPFRLSWIFYLMGFLLLFLHFLFRKKTFFYGALCVFASAFCMQGYGMLLRSMVMGRPPVTNMYETVIWVPWIVVILGTVLWLRQKVFTVFACACAVALFCLLLADSVPTLLDGGLEPLEAVLRSNFWLMTHVLIITMSYSAFFLAFAIGDVLLFMFWRDRKRGLDQDKVRSYVKCIDHSIQVGVVLLAAGTILGGIWADYSWGRFWGWDPKETWALISLLGYLVLLHGRLVGWIKEFGMAVSSVLMFFLIVMAWYGVNYVLGQGLHSYGFGSGGVEYVAGFALLHLIYVLLVFLVNTKNVKT